MMDEVRDQVTKVGLEMHLGKTKIPANRHGRKNCSKDRAGIGHDKIIILEINRSTKYLGGDLSF